MEIYTAMRLMKPGRKDFQVSSSDSNSTSIQKNAEDSFHPIFLSDPTWGEIGIRWRLTRRWNPSWPVSTKDDHGWRLAQPCHVSQKKYTDGPTNFLLKNEVSKLGTPTLITLIMAPDQNNCDELGCHPIRNKSILTCGILSHQKKPAFTIENSILFI